MPPMSKTSIEALNQFVENETACVRKSSTIVFLAWFYDLTIAFQELLLEYCTVSQNVSLRLC